MVRLSKVERALSLAHSTMSQGLDSSPVSPSSCFLRASRSVTAAPRPITAPFHLTPRCATFFSEKESTMVTGSTMPETRSASRSRTRKKGYTGSVSPRKTAATEEAESASLSRSSRGTVSSSKAKSGCGPERRISPISSARGSASVFRKDSASPAPAMGSLTRERGTPENRTSSMCSRTGRQASRISASSPFSSRTIWLWARRFRRFQKISMEDPAPEPEANLSESGLCFHAGLRSSHARARSLNSGVPSGLNRLSLPAR